MQLTIDQAFQKAIEAHRAGQIQEADRLYTAILKAQPKHPDTNHNLGVLAVSVGKVRAALPFLMTALEANPSIAQFWVSYIDALIRLDRIADAKAVLDQAKNNGAKGNSFEKLKQRLEDIDCSSNSIKSKVQDTPKDQVQSLIDLYNKGQLEQAFEQTNSLLNKFPTSAMLLNIKGSILKGMGQLELSIDAYRKTLAIKPDYADAYYNMGNALKEQGKLDDTIEAYKKALAIKPDHAEAYNNLGNVFKEQDNLEEAIEAHKKAIAIKPDYADAFNNIGNALKAQGKLDETIEAYKKAIAINPDYADAYNNMGNALKEQDNLEAALVAYKRAIAIKPDFADAYYNMANALREQGELEEAIGAYKKALIIKPDYAEAYKNMGVTFQEYDKLKEAIEAFEKALVIKPNDPEIYNNMSFAKLLTNNWQEGIALRKWRWHTKRHQSYKRSFNAPEWDGNELAHNKTLLVWAEQGPGDVVIWSSCISHYANIFKKIIIECHPKLIDLLKRSFPDIVVRSSKDRSVHSAEDFDFQVPMETLFGYACLIGACTETQSRYLFPDSERVNYWSTELRKISSKKTVGLSWKSPLMTRQRAKNYPGLSHWGNTLQKYKSKFTFVNLQSKDYQEDIAFLKDHFDCEIVHFDQLDLYDDLSDVAALSQALDCCISVATAAATISAAVGTLTIIPTWKQSSWNNILFNSRGPAVDILLKNSSESWAPVFEEIATKLKVLGTEH